MNGEVQKVLFFAKARKYPTALEMALDGPNIPISVYTRLDRRREQATCRRSIAT